ncbi:MAG: SDR family NAD(P)-dependent oxidoreductase [Alphaproteobacteria bacterium]|nr:MAG: SDR family NAD(P)-dependent oxidoreductase [Alphaproteobacteria bacterium]
MIVWVTGASSGLGREVARQYAAEGHTVVAFARSADKLAALAADTTGFRGEILVHEADVTDRASLGPVFEAAIRETGVPDVAILNAGTHVPTPARDFSLAPYERLMAVNYFGVLNCLEILLPHLRTRVGGQVAIVASLAGYRGLPHASAYGASKAALINLAESMKEELALEGIYLRLVNPGFVKTPLTDLNDFPMPFLMPVADAARALRRGLAGHRFEISFPWRFAVMMKLFRLLPDRLHLALCRRMLADKK